MKQYLRYIGPVLISCIFVGAVYLLYHKLKAYSIEQIRESLSQIPQWRIWASVGLMIVNYLILIGYDWLALVAIKKPLPLQRTALVSFIGQAVSYNFGALLGGTTVRYRFYASWGFSLHDIVRLVLMLAVTFWVGALGLCGLAFIIAPPEIPLELLNKMPIKDVRILGALLLGVTLVYFVACHFVRKPIQVFGKEFEFPKLKIALLQALVAGIDLIVAAGCMYVLLPGDLGISFVNFLPSYLMAQVAVVLTHVPGGVGVFELVILHLTHTPREQVVIAAVLCFRIIYFILPVLAAALFLAIYEARQNKAALRDAGRWVSVFSPSINAWATFCAGLILLVVTVLPVWSHDHVFHVVDWGGSVSLLLHWLCAFSGAVLLFLSCGLEMRQVRAWYLSLFFLSLGLVCALLKGVNILAALMIFLVLLAVFLGSKRFYRKSIFWQHPMPLRWVAASWLVLLGCLGLAYLLFERQNENLLHKLGPEIDASFNFYAILSVYFVIAIIWIWRITQRVKYKKQT